jgi:hypothetical protein
MQSPFHSKNERSYGIILLGAIISCFIALYNNYPLVYPDTGSYLHSGWDNVVFYDRTIFYGLFIFEASYGGSPLLMVFAQAILVSYLLYVTLKMFFAGLQRKYFYIGAITFLTLFTGYSYTVSILIPDIFSSITILCLINLLLNKKINFLHSFFIAVIFIYSICTQFSSIPVLALVYGFTFLFLIWQKITKRQQIISFKKYFLALGLCVSTLFIIPAVHYHYDGYYKISGSNHVFVLNHLLETGVLEDYLDKACKDHDYKICAYKDSLGWDFIWSESSPLQKTGGWEANRTEYKAIIKDLLSKDQYFWMVFRKGIEYSFKQFFTFQTTVSPSQMEGSAPYGQVQWRLPDTRREYIAALQQSNKLKLGFVNAAEQVVILCSMVFLFVTVLTPALRNRLSAHVRWMTVLLLIYSISSAIMCSNLSTVHPRFLNRIVWLFPFCAGIIALEYWNDKKARTISDQAKAA